MMQISDLPTVFSDLERIPQDDGPTAVCRIDYTEDFVMAHDYFRAVQKIHERSLRALDLTTLCLQLNPANYTIWHYRRQILEHLDLYQNSDQQNRDLELAATLGGANPKNYQIWYHRRAFLEQLRDDEDKRQETLQNELTYIATVIQQDGKNYHAWSHRQWILSTLAKDTDSDSLWESELEYTSNLIRKDGRNNSAWNGRWFAMHRGNQEATLSADEIQQQIEYTLEVARIDPYNPSPWRFLLALIKKYVGNGDEEGKKKELIAEVESIQIEVVEPSGQGPCAPLLGALVDLLGDHSPEVAVQHLETLKECDPIRVKYWNLRQSQLIAR